MKAEVNFDVECTTCRHTLEATFVAPARFGQAGTVRVEPCAECLRSAYREGLEEQREGRDAKVMELKEEIEDLEVENARLEGECSNFARAIVSLREQLAVMKMVTT